ASNLTVREMQRAPDFSFGYEYNSTTKETKRQPMLDIPSAAPAGAINSNARDMARWLRLMLGGGLFDGRRLVSEKNFNELVSKQMKIGGNVSYGLGWFLREWKGRKVVEHGGNIPGFNALVALMPEEKLGVVMLTNVTASPLGQTVMEAVWSNMTAKPEDVAKSNTSTDGGATNTPAAMAVDPAREAGTYNFAAAGFDIRVDFKDGKLSMSVPGQPEYTLENVGGRRYKLTGPQPIEGFFATFRPAKGDEAETEMYLEQPQGNYVLPRAKPAAAATAAAASPAGPAAEYSGPHKELVGTYEGEQNKAKVEVAVRDEKVSLVVPGQPAYPLVEKSKDVFNSTLLPDSYSVAIRRDAAGAV
ncbi:MAG: serine hydrolase domain-containing protein, partial [Pyrinomonadaceae bacterium]